jgi:hypothetical protein
MSGVEVKADSKSMASFARRPQQVFIAGAASYAIGNEMLVLVLIGAM